MILNLIMFKTAGQAELTAGQAELAQGSPNLARERHQKGPDTRFHTQFSVCTVIVFPAQQTSFSFLSEHKLFAVVLLTLTCIVFAALLTDHFSFCFCCGTA
jgi:hypothetical protein